MEKKIRTKIADTSGQDQQMDNEEAIKGKRTKIIIAISATLVVFLLLVNTFSRWNKAEAAISRDRIIIGTVERGNFVRDISANGQVVAAISPTLYSTGTGTVTFNVKSGTQVTEQQILAVIDSPETRNLLEQERSTLQSLEIEYERERIQSKIQQLQNSKTIDLAKVRLTAAERELRRSKAAWQQKNISAIDYEKSQDDLENAKLEYTHANADAKLSNESLDFEVRTRALLVDRQKLQVANQQRKVDDLSIRSPVNGIVGNLLIDQKSNVSGNQAILSVVDLTKFEIEIQIAESYADDISIGMHTEIRIDGQLLQGQLISISPEIINNQVTSRVSFIGVSPTNLRANQRVAARIIMEERDDVLMLRRGQFVSETGGRIAYKIDEDIAYRTALEVGARSLSHIEILQGAEVGDQIILSSLASFGESDTVLITN